MELCIDTSTEYASVGLSQEGIIVSELSWHAKRNHSMELVPTIRQLMERAGEDFENLQAVFVAKGPGGFSALRIGLSVAKSLALAQSIPLIGIGTLDIEAYPFVNLNFPVCAIIDAGKDLVYKATYTIHRGELLSTNYSVEDYETLVASHKVGTVYCGEGVPSVSKLFWKTSGVDALLIDTPPPTRRSSVLAKLGYKRFERNDLDDLGELKPIYIRGSQFEVALSSTA